MGEARAGRKPKNQIGGETYHEQKEKATMDCEGKGLPTIEYFNEDCMVGMARSWHRSRYRI